MENNKLSINDKLQLLNVLNKYLMFKNNGTDDLQNIVKKKAEEVIKSIDVK